MAEISTKSTIFLYRNLDTLVSKSRHNRIDLKGTNVRKK